MLMLQGFWMGFSLVPFLLFLGWSGRFLFNFVPRATRHTG